MKKVESGGRNRVMDKDAAEYFNNLEENKQQEWQDKWIKDYPTDINAPRISKFLI